MIYVVKCFYCEHEFKVKRGETGADMMCPECGGKNSIRDVIKRIEDKKTIDPDLQAIKDFDISKHPVINDETYAEERERELLVLLEEMKPLLIVLAVILVIILSIIFTMEIPMR